jgi:hypothetical protein
VCHEDGSAAALHDVIKGTKRAVYPVRVSDLTVLDNVMVKSDKNYLVIQVSTLNQWKTGV